MDNYNYKYHYTTLLLQLQVQIYHATLHNTHYTTTTLITANYI